jgi:hypothetical protein
MRPNISTGDAVRHNPSGRLMRVLAVTDTVVSLRDSNGKKWVAPIDTVSGKLCRDCGEREAIGMWCRGCAGRSMRRV